MGLLRPLVLLLFAAASGAAPVTAWAGRDSAVEYLDERTGATLTVATRPLIFAQRQSVLAANARDYVALTAAEIDRSGEPALYFVGYLWSTIDRRGPARDPRPARRRILLMADARPLVLTPEAEYPRDLTDDRQLSSPGRKYQDRQAYRVTAEQLRYIAGSRTLSVRLLNAGDAADAEPGDDEADAEPFELWQDGRASLAALVRLIGPG